MDDENHMNEEDRNIIMADIEGRWYETSPQTGRNDQESVNIYTTLIIQLIVINPYISAAQLLDNISHIPQAGPRSRILRLFGGWDVFVNTVRRMEPLRAGIATGNINNLPITTRAPEHDGMNEALPNPDGHIAWWAPQVGMNAPPFLFRMIQNDDETLRRYPHQGIYTNDHSEESLGEMDAQSDDF